MAEISLQLYCQQIEDIVEQGHYAEAVAHGKHILTQYPKHLATYQVLGKTMLEARRHQYAADMFRRVLSADPENLLAWVAMSEVSDQQDELDAAVWYLERAFELSADNEAVEEELRRYYGRRDGAEPQRIELTRGALARLYLKGDLLSRAINEFRALLAEHPERVDIGVALAEALWRNDQRLEASEVCQQVLDVLPYCLKANLILGEIWTGSGREEGQIYLRRAEAVDPENRVAQELFGPASPLPAREVRIVPLEYAPEVEEEERPAWMTGLEPAPGERVPLAGGAAALADVTAALEAQIEIPSWLEEVAEEENAAPALPGPAGSWEEQPPEETPPIAAEEVPEWMADVDQAFGEEQIETVSEAEAPAWLAGLDIESLEEKEATTGQPTEMGPEPTGEEVPEWLSGLDVEAVGEEALPAAPPTEESPGWLTDIRQQFAEGAEAPQEPAPTTLTPAPAEVPDWLHELAPSAEQVEAAIPAAEAEEVPMPDWLEGEGLPSGDDALAWLEQLAEGKEEELQAKAQAEAKARMAEIMGRPTPAEAPTVEAPPAEAVVPPSEEPIAPLVRAAVAPLIEETAAMLNEALPVEEAAPAEEPAPVTPPPTMAEVPDWLHELAPSAEQMEAAAPAAEAETEEIPMPDWLEGEGLPSGDDALAWLEQLAEGKEEELQAKAQAEAEARMAEIMGRPTPTEPPAVEAPPEEAIVPPGEEAIAPLVGAAVAPLIEETAAMLEETPTPPALSAEEAFGWTTFGEPEAPPETIVAAEAAAAPEALEWEGVKEEEEIEPPAPVAEAAEVPMPDWLAGEGLPSGDDALAWLEQLAEGKEEELQAKAQAEAEARMAEIMGRPVPAEPPAVEAPPAEAPPAEAPPAEAFVPPGEEAIAPPIEEAAPVIEEALVPLIEEPVAVMEEAPPAEAVAPAALAAELPPVEEAPSPEEIPAPEITLPTEEVHWGAAVETPPEAVVALAPVTEEVPGIPEMEVPEEVEEAEEAEEVAAPPKAPPIEVPPGPFAAERAHLKQHSRDYEAWLALARALWQADERQRALEAYSRVIRAGKLLDSVIPDLQQYVQQWPDVSTQRVLGDAYMKDGQLREALDIYRHALETL